MELVLPERKAQLLKDRELVLRQIDVHAMRIWREYFEGLSADEIKVLVDETDLEGNLLLPKESIGFSAAKDIFGSKTPSTAATYSTVAARIDAEVSTTAGLESYNSRGRD